MEQKFGASDYRDAIGELLELSQTRSVEEYTTTFENLQFEICMHNNGFGEMFFVSQVCKHWCRGAISDSPNCGQGYYAG